MILELVDLNAFEIVTRELELVSLLCSTANEERIRVLYTHP